MLRIWLPCRRGIEGGINTVVQTGVVVEQAQTATPTATTTEDATDGAGGADDVARRIGALYCVLVSAPCHARSI